jgi:hypothetical protein
VRQMGDHHEMGFGGRQPRHCSETSEGGDAKPETAKLSVFSDSTRLSRHPMSASGRIYRSSGIVSMMLHVTQLASPGL